MRKPRYLVRETVTLMRESVQDLGLAPMYMKHRRANRRLSMLKAKAHRASACTVTVLS